MLTCFGPANLFLHIVYKLNHKLNSEKKKCFLVYLNHSPTMAEKSNWFLCTLPRLVYYYQFLKFSHCWLSFCYLCHPFVFSFYSRWCSSKQLSWLPHRAPISIQWRPSQPLRCSKWQLSTSTAWWLPQWRPLQVGGTLEHFVTQVYCLFKAPTRCTVHHYSSTEQCSVSYAMARKCTLVLWVL